MPRCLLPGRPTPDCLFCDVNKDGATALKVWNLNPCGGVVAAFNVQASWAAGGGLGSGEGWGSQHWLGGPAGCHVGVWSGSGSGWVLSWLASQGETHLARLETNKLRPHAHLHCSWCRLLRPARIPLPPPQGASWSAPRRGFHFHDSQPPAVTAHIKPADVQGLAAGPTPVSGGSGGSSSASFAVWVDGRQVSGKGELPAGFLNPRPRVYSIFLCFEEEHPGVGGWAAGHSPPW